jgi:hypothetical protein
MNSWIFWIAVSVLATVILCIWIDAKKADEEFELRYKVNHSVQPIENDNIKWDRVIVYIAMFIGCAAFWIVVIMSFIAAVKFIFG